MQVIETEYNGYRFRSRAEARWAVFFDEAGIQYMYEAEGFEFADGTRYLPDFYLPEINTFVEVKGVMTDEDLHKIELLWRESKADVIIGYSDMTFERFRSSKYHTWLIHTSTNVRFGTYEDKGTFICNGNLRIAEGDDLIMAAIRTARSKRFEHEERS